MKKLTQEEFIIRSTIVHNNKYDYSKVHYVNGVTPVDIVCPVHGVFSKTPQKHLNAKQGCPKCSLKTRGLKHRSNTEEFIKKAKEIHGDKYDYSKTVYKKAIEKVIITCPKHGDFMQIPNSHLNGNGCPMCGRGVNSVDKRSTTEEFIEKAKAIHGDKYDYSNVNYHYAVEKVEIICPIHGSFWQTPNAHLCGFGCTKCGLESMAMLNTVTPEEFIERAKVIHDNKYDYSKVVYTNYTTPVEIVCPAHGVFMQTPEKHLMGRDCYQCAVDKQRLTTEEFIEKAKKAHGDKYDYSEVTYKSAQSKVKITCKTCGYTFFQAPYTHSVGHGCPNCAEINPKAEQEIFSFINDTLGITTLKNDRTIIGPKELDIFVPKFNVAIEHTGNYYHSSKVRTYDCASHLKEKFDLCMDKDIKLFTIYEDEWLLKPNIVKSMIANAVGKATPIYARKTTIKCVDGNDTRMFLDANHIQGKTAFQYAYGLYYNDELVSIMTFTEPRMNMGRNKENSPDSIELSRFCCKLNTRVVGGASKLLKAFIKEHPEYTTIYSYSDNRISNGKLYQALGFEFTHNVQPNYCYVSKKDGCLKRTKKQKYRKKEIAKMGIDITGKTEYQLTEELGLYRLYDAGKKCWTLNTNKKPAN